MTDTFNPDSWLTSALDSIQDYIRDALNNSILDANNNPAGSEIFDVVMEFPASTALPSGVEAGKTIVHFEIDDIDNTTLGFGESFVNRTIQDGTPSDPGYVTEEEAGRHVINFDVGIWASDKSGGPSNRALAYQTLDQVLRGPIARDNCMEQTQGVELVRFQNGRFVTEMINDVRLFRMVGAELVVRVFSRKVAEPEILVDGDIIQEPHLTIDSVDLVEDE